MSVTHDIQYIIDRLVLRGDTQIGRLRNRLAFGGEYSAVDFDTQRRFGDTSAVEPYEPARGLFPEGDNAMVFGRRQNRDNRVSNGAARCSTSASQLGLCKRRRALRWSLLVAGRY